jgi:hypothetical protein
MHYSDQSLFGVTLYRIKNDANSNPRYLINPLDLARTYEVGAHIAKTKLQARKYRGKGEFIGAYVISDLRSPKQIIFDIIDASLILEKKEVFGFQQLNYAPERSKLHVYEGDALLVPNANNFDEAKKIASELYGVNFTTLDDAEYLIKDIAQDNNL